MKPIKRIAMAAILLLGVAQPSLAQPFSNLYFLGDSLTDAGFYQGARFTVNPGSVWAQYLGSAYGFTITPVTVGGTDFAQGGARVTLPSPLITAISAAAPQRSLAVQVNELLQASPTLDPNALYGVWAGANDVLVNVSAVATGQINAAQLQSNIGIAANETLQEVTRLHNAGARHIMVLNLPNIGTTPLGLSQPSAPFAALSDLYTSTLNAGLNNIGFDVIRLDVKSLFAEIVANPSAFGFTNVTTPACSTASSLTCTAATLVAPNAASTYLFADAVHPTPAGHKIVADYAQSVLTAPALMGLLAEAPLQVEQANFRVLDARMMTGRASRRWEAYAVYDYGSLDVDPVGVIAGGPSGGDARTHTLMVGGDVGLTSNLLLGIAFGYTENKTDFGNGNGGFKLNEATLTSYAAYLAGPWYAGASIGAGDLDYRDIRRQFGLGMLSRTERSDAKGSHLMGRAIAGMNLKAGAISHGPFVKLTYQDVKVDSFGESGSSSTAMFFAEQKRHSFTSSAGWQVSGTWGAIKPYARATWEHEFKDSNRSVRAGLISTGSTFAMDAYRPDDSWALLDVGASMGIGANASAFVSVNASGGKSDGDFFAVTVGIRVPL